MAAVAKVFTAEPRARSAEELIESLLLPELERSQDEESPRPRPERERGLAGLSESERA